MKARYLLAVAGLLLAGLAARHRSLAALVRQNMRSLCITRLAAQQTGTCDPPYVFSGGWRLCDLLWPVPGDAMPTGEILLDTARLSAGGAYWPKTDSWRTQKQIVHKGRVVLWWNSVIAVPLDLPVGLYRLQLHGVNDRPGPVLLHLSASGEPLGILRFDRDDDSWETKCVLLHPMHWPQGGDREAPLTLSIAFINDGGPKGSRDAYIDWVRLIPLSVQRQ